MTFSNENAFKKYLCGKFNGARFDVVKVESHGTEVGIPDTFIQGNGKDYWVEFKNGTIKYRPGQEAWYFNYKDRHTLIQHHTAAYKYVLVAAAFADTIYLIPKDGIESTFELTEERLQFLPSVLEWLATDCLRAWETTLREQLVSTINRCFPQVEEDWQPEMLLDEQQLDKEFTLTEWKQNKCSVLERLIDLILDLRKNNY